MAHTMQRMLLANSEGVSCADCEALQHPAVIASDWIGFICLFGSATVLVVKLMSFKGPDQDDKYYFGYREDKMISVFVNLFAAMAYWAKLASHMNGDVGPAANVVTYKYLDYVFTCPLLTADLLWSLNLPYKFTYAGFVGVCIICAFMATTCPAPAKFMWFGMGFTLFLYTWYSILTLVKMRLDQMVSKEVKKVRFYLKLACTTYFAIWIGYPTLWVLYEANLIDAVTSHLMHVLFDVIAKSVYGFALLFFVVGGSKHEFVFLELKPTVEKTDEDSEDEEKEKEHIVIGSKKNKRGSSKSRHNDDFGAYPATQFQGGESGDINATAAEIYQLNQQLENIMAKEKSMEMQTRQAGDQV